MKKILPLILIAISASLYSFTLLVSATRDDSLVLGNPSNARTEISSGNNYLIQKGQYTLSYNSSKGIPNWVSWHLSAAWKGKYKRKDKFKADTAVPTLLYKVKKADYTNSGFDKGHMCPSDDRDGNKIDNEATFFMTNMIPQSPVCNQQTWGDLEEYCRDLAEAGNELYIIAGPSGKGGSGSKGIAKTIAKGKIEVPKYVWKVILIIPNGSDDVHRIDENTRTIAVKMPNKQNVNTKEWYEYRVTIDAVEQLTGYDFFSEVEDGVENIIEQIKDSQEIE